LTSANYFHHYFQFLLIFYDRFARGEDNTLRTSIDQYLAAQTALQQVSNPSGTVSTGGLGEPKFNIDGSAFTGPWGRHEISP
jgi:glucoamylase